MDDEKNRDRLGWLKFFDEGTICDAIMVLGDGEVSDLRHSGSVVSAEIYAGGWAYHVSLDLDRQDTPDGMSCDCHAARKGKICYHMAAICLTLEAEMDEPSGEDAPVPGGPEESPEKEREDTRALTPFERLAGSPEYHYFDLNYMVRNMPVPASLFEEGRRLWERGDVSLESLSLDYPRYGKMNLVGQASGTVRGNDETYSLTIEFCQNCVTGIYCGCSAKFYSYDGEPKSSVSGTFCRHGTALLYALEDHILRRNPGDATDAGATRLLAGYEESRGGNTGTSENAGDKTILHLEPRLIRVGWSMAADFKVGTTGRMYKLKDLPGFVGQFERGEQGSFGKKTVIDYSECVLDDFSLQCFRFIQDAVQEERIRGSYLPSGAQDRGSDSPAAARESVPLIGRRLDAFYDMVNGRQFEYDPRHNWSWGRDHPEKTITCRDARPEAYITVEKLMNGKGEFDGISVSGAVPAFTEGMSYYYRVAEEDCCLERVPKESMKDLLLLRRAVDNLGQIRFSLGRGHLGWFYHTFLPALQSSASVRVTEPDAEFIAAFIPPEPDFRFYLDAEDGDLSCLVSALYGETEVNVSGLLSGGDDDAVQPWRDSVREEETVRRAMKYFPEYDNDQGFLRCGQDEDAVFRVLSAGVSALMELGEVNCTDRFLRLKIRPLPKFRVGVSMGSGLLDLDISSEDLSREELLDILDGYRQKKRYIRLKNGDFLRTDDGEDRVEALADMLDALRITPKEFVKGKMQVPAYRALYLDRMLEESSGIYAKRDSRFRNLVKEFKTVSDSDFEVPESLAPTLRGYQAEGYKWLRTLEAYHFGGILADDMGLGKTLQMIAVFLAWKEEGKEEPSLVVCPASLVYNWGEEISRFAPQLNVALVAGTQKEREKMLADHGRYDVLVTSYDLLKRDIDRYEDITFLGQVLDEAQFIKNHTTAAAKSVKLINSQYRFALTGTPIENRLSELWSIFDFLMPGFLYGYDIFKKEIEIPIVKKGDKNATKRLRRMVSPFILRRLKKDVLKDLPEKIEKVVYAKAETKQQRLCDGQTAHIQELLSSQDEEKFSRDKIKTLAELTKLREICCDPSLLFEDYAGGSAKREACLELIGQAMEGGHRMLVFSQFTSMLALLEKDLDREGISYYKIIGATPKQERVELVRKFNEGDVPVFLISLKAGGTGLNLTGADIVIHYDPWWNMAAEDQATDRAHRIGQTRVVTEYKLILKDSVEERILKMQEAKSDLADEILSGEESAPGLGSLSREDLLELLGV